MDGPVIAGERVLLRPLRPEDRESRRRLGWWAAVERGFGHVEVDRDATTEEADAWYAGQQALADDPAAVSWVVEVAGDLAGVARLHSLREHDRAGRYAVGLLHPLLLGRGLGTEVTGLVLDHAFGPMGLHRVDLRVLADNAAAVACYARCGFVVEGRERESCLMGGRRHDDLIMGVLATDPREGLRT